MTHVAALQTAVALLPKREYSQFRRWFLERDWQEWDREIEEDSRAGRLDFLLQEAAEAKREGRLRDL